jgi:murein DD-endopeptidase MepM/ murein hydrolase activator NlpD
MSKFEEVLRNCETSTLFPGQSDSHPFLFDFSDENKELDSIDLNDRDQFQSYINKKISENDASFGIGKYAENRILYRRFGLFESEDSRSFHLGLDIWMKAGTAISAPMDSVVHSFADNAHPGDYGPTIILSHRFQSMTFYTLYGHLSKDSFKGIEKGKEIKAGKTFCRLGKWEENLLWPPHLHFQVIRDMQSYEGDFPGVCNFDEREKWMDNCPDPNLLLRIKF